MAQPTFAQRQQQHAESPPCFQSWEVLGERFLIETHSCSLENARRNQACSRESVAEDIVEKRRPRCWHQPERSIKAIRAIIAPHEVSRPQSIIFVALAIAVDCDGPTELIVKYALAQPKRLIHEGLVTVVLMRLNQNEQGFSSSC